MSGVGLELHDAATTGDYDAIRDYIRSGKFYINLGDIDVSNRTALHWACQKGNEHFYLDMCASLMVRTPT